MTRHWLLGQAQELPAEAILSRRKGYATKTNAAPGDDDDVDFLGSAYHTKSKAAPGDDDDLDFQHERPRKRAMLTKTEGSPGDDDDIDSSF